MAKAGSSIHHLLGDLYILGGIGIVYSEQIVAMMKKNQFTQRSIDFINKHEFYPHQYFNVPRQSRPEKLLPYAIKVRHQTLRFPDRVDQVCRSLQSEQADRLHLHLQCHLPNVGNPSLTVWRYCQSTLWCNDFQGLAEYISRVKRDTSAVRSSEFYSQPHLFCSLIIARFQLATDHPTT